jgi:aquaporin Z
MLTLNVRKALAELFGTFVLVFTGFSAVYFAGAGLVGISLAFGLALAGAIFALGHISGAHFNPAVSLAMLIDKRLSVKEFAIYVVSQLAGSALAAVVVFLIAGAPTGTAAVVSDEALKVFGYEVILTFVFVYVILAASQRKTYLPIIGLVVGLTLTSLILAGGNVSGAALNPAAALAPTLFGNVAPVGYLVIAAGTLVGGALAAVVYKFLKFTDDQTA